MHLFGRHLVTILLVGFLTSVPMSTIISSEDIEKELFASPHFTSGQLMYSDYSIMSLQGSSAMYMPTSGERFSFVGNQTGMLFATGDETAPDGSGQDMLRLSAIRSNATTISWFSENYTHHSDYSSYSHGKVSLHPIGDGNVLLASSACNGPETIQENQNSQIFNDPACETEAGIDSEGPMVRLFLMSVQENNTLDLGSITYDDCGKRPQSGGGGSGWNYRFFTPGVNDLAVHGNASNFSIMLGHRHNYYDASGTSSGWPSVDTSRCKIQFNGTDIGSLPGDDDWALDYITIVNNTASIERLSSNLVDVRRLAFTSTGDGLWSGMASGSGEHMTCEDFANETSISLTNFSISDSQSQSGIAYIPGKLTESSADKLALVDTSDCTVVTTYQTYVHLQSQSWTDESGFTRIVARNPGTSATTQFNRTINRGVTFEATVAPNGSFLSLNSTSVTANTPWDYQGYESIPSSGTYPSLNARDVDGDLYPDIKDHFPFDSTEHIDTDGDGYGNNGDACPSAWGNSSIDRFGCFDADGDGVSDLIDAFINDPSQQSDLDSDGFGDNATGNLPDACPAAYGDSSRGGQYGCPDADGDRWADQIDEFPNDGSQWNDTDDDGYGDSLIGFQGDACPVDSGQSTEDRYGCLDTDLDGWSDLGDAFPFEPTQWSDRDLDGFGDNQSASANLSDAFPSDSTQWNDSDGDTHGDNPYGTQGDWFPNDPNRWQDSDRDGVADEDDAFPNDASQTVDSDGDGYGDNENGSRSDAFPDDALEWIDSDGDGYGNNRDEFPNDGTQWNDTDEDGYGDNPFGTQGDRFPDDPTRWQDSDVDGVADEDDAFPNDASQTLDSDGDGYGDNENGSRSDAFPDDALEWIDSDGDGYGNNQDEFPNDGTQWNDTDEDGYGDNPYGTQGDWFPNDPNRWQDSDRDGVADEDDAFPNEATQTSDLDGDGYGDNPTGFEPDAFPSDVDEWIDSDGDGRGNNADAFPFDPSQTNDTDGDGFGDNPRGTGADKFPDDVTQWSDIDGDGFGDNPEGTSADAFISDATQWADADGDGYGDNPSGRLADGFPDDFTQWEDQDGDGFGDNQSGNNPDPSLFDFDNDGYNDSIDPLPRLASPGDLDNDGTVDEQDIFPSNFREWADADGDGEGDNADADDDNDGWTDTTEARQGTDPFSSVSQPVDSFEIVLPGTAIGLGAWDLIGIFGGVPLFVWIGFGFMTRNGRTARFESMLREATTRDGLEEVARQWEYSLMLRLLGPHQGIRLERLRAELDDVFEQQNQPLSSLHKEGVIQPTLASGVMIMETENRPDIGMRPEIDQKGVPDEQGYEWITTDDGTNWYRTFGSSDEWEVFTT